MKPRSSNKLLPIAVLARLSWILPENLHLAQVLPLMARPSQPEGDYDCWQTARIDPNIAPEEFSRVRTIFGYGSLIFRPGFPYKRMYPASVTGFIRRFWQRSCDHRGTPENPGRVVALLRADSIGKLDLGEVEVVGEVAKDDIVFGMAYEVDEADWPSVIEALDVRERHGYTRTLAKLSPLKRDVDNAEAVDPGLGTAVVYFAHEPENSAAYTGPEVIETTAAVIANAKGPSGPNDAYLFSLVDALESHGLPPDRYLTSLSAAVREKPCGGSCQTQSSVLPKT